jgi:DNA-binding transcriptional LysR family regulator
MVSAIMIAVPNPWMPPQTAPELRASRLFDDRWVATVVSSVSAALSLAQDTEFIATVPEHHTKGLRRGMYCFTLPFETPAFTLSMLWHPRMDADLAHRWLRGCIRLACEA